MRRKPYHSKMHIRGNIMFDRESNELLIKLKVMTALWLVSFVIGLVAVLDNHC